MRHYFDLGASAPRSLFLKQLKNISVRLCYVMYVMLYILYLKSTHKNSLQKTIKYRLIDATLTTEDQVWSLAVVALLLPQPTQMKFKQ